MYEFSQVDLRGDAQAATYIKDEVVEVVFAESDGVLTSREGPNRYSAGDALITGSTGDRWSVSRERFDVKYEALSSTPASVSSLVSKPYRNKPMPVLARQIDGPFTIARSAGGDVLRGNAGDWLLQYAPDDYGVVENARFQKVYRPAP